MSPFPPSLLADQVPRPGVPMCTRLINGLITSRELVLTWLEWFFNADGTLSQNFLNIYCYLDCECNPTQYGTLTPDVKSTTPVYFNSDAYFPAGTYQVGYVSGGMHYSVANHNWYVQNPFNPANGWFVKYNAGVDQVKGPGVTTGYSTLPLCQAGNIGSEIEFVHTGGKIGVVLVDSPSNDNSGAITFSLLQCAPTTTTTTTSTTTPTTTTTTTSCNCSNFSATPMDWMHYDGTPPDCTGTPDGPTSQQDICAAIQALAVDDTIQFSNEEWEVAQGQAVVDYLNLYCPAFSFTVEDGSTTPCMGFRLITRVA